MEINDLESALEAVLFASGDPMPVSRLADIFEVDKKTLERVLSSLRDRLNFEKRGVTLLKLGDTYQMATKQEYADYVKLALDRRRDTVISGASLETLAIIAYKQPVTKGYIEQVRGVDSGGVINNLLEKGLVEDKGKLDVPGHPRLYGTTPDFLRCFGLSSIAELPPLADYVQEEEGEQAAPALI